MSEEKTAPAIDELRADIREIILNDLDVQVDNPDLITYETPLYGIDSGLNLDSVVLVELMVAIEDKYEITFEDDQAALGQIFVSVGALADYTQERIKLAQTEGISTELQQLPEDDKASPGELPPPGTLSEGGMTA